MTLSRWFGTRNRYAPRCLSATRSVTLQFLCGLGMVFMSLRSFLFRATVFIHSSSKYVNMVLSVEVDHKVSHVICSFDYNSVQINATAGIALPAAVLLRLHHSACALFGCVVKNAPQCLCLVWTKSRCLICNSGNHALFWLPPGCHYLAEGNGKLVKPVGLSHRRKSTGPIVTLLASPLPVLTQTRPVAPADIHSFLKKQSARFKFTTDNSEDRKRDLEVLATMQTTEFLHVLARSAPPSLAFDVVTHRHLAH